MPTQPALDIVNALFAGQKDLSDYVDTAMKTVAVDHLDNKKQEIGKQMFATTENTPEETSNETDQGGD
jgi:hypothetical protein